MAAVFCRIGAPGQFMRPRPPNPLKIRAGPAGPEIVDVGVQMVFSLPKANGTCGGAPRPPPTCHWLREGKHHLDPNIDDFRPGRPCVSDLEGVGAYFDLHDFPGP